MPAEILSLDLDWFNHTDKKTLRSEIRGFFANLKKECVLPRYIDFVPEHQYLYPWSIKLIDGLSYKKMNVVNIDEHHDFYSLHRLDLDDETSTVGCWNFFAFMAHRHLMGKYTWVTNFNTKKAAKYNSVELMNGISTSKSPVLRRFGKKIKVVTSEEVFNVVRNKCFDGFMIIRSPEYTNSYRSVYHAVEEALRLELPKKRVRRYQCRANYKNGRVHHRANSLFWQV